MRVLVTGGAGYIGSHMVHLLLRMGHDVSVIDDLRTGHIAALPAQIPWLRTDVADQPSVDRFMRTQRVEAIIHFASLIEVGESMKAPRRYYVGNAMAGIALLESALDVGVKHVILSSTAAVYGNPTVVPIPETHPLAPINVYGATKLTLENMLASYHAAYGLGYMALRYFNAAGADVEAALGEAHRPETHLIPLVLDAALGRRKSITVYGTDYDTPDGTCIRDYVHVKDLCRAHLLALQHLASGGQSGAVNLGTGSGYSVREVITAAEKASRRTVPVTNGPRREGDPPRLVADVEKARRLLGWTATESSLERIMDDAYRSRVSMTDGTKPAGPSWNSLVEEPR